METVPFVLLAVFVFYAIIKYSMLTAFALWRRRNQSKLYLYKTFSDPYEYLTDDIYYAAMQFELSIPGQNFKSLYNLVKSIKNNRITNYPQWVYDGQSSIKNYADLLSKSIEKKDCITTLGVTMGLWVNEILEEQLPNCYEVVHNFLKDNQDSVSTLLSVGADEDMLDDITNFMADISNGLAIAGKMDESKWVAKFINGVMLKNAPIGDWLTEEEYKEVMTNAENVRATFQGVGCSNTYEALQYAIENNAHIGGLIVLNADWKDTGKGELDDEISDQAYNILMNTPNYRSIFTKDEFVAINSKIMDNFEGRGMMDKVAELSELNKDLDDKEPDVIKTPIPDIIDKTLEK